MTVDDLVLGAGPLTRAWGDCLSAPTEATRLIADKAVEGRIFFYGEDEIAIGRSDIDWAGTHRNHQEWRAQLNRFTWLGPLASVYRETGAEKYAEAARAYIADWMRAHPSGAGWQKGPYDSVLNLCIRMGHSQIPGWTGCLPVFMHSPAFDGAFATEVITSCQTQLDFLLDNIAGSINWRIANADALVVAGTRLSFLPGSERWRRQGVRIINDAWHRQILPDGAHYERNPSYHAWMTRVMTNYWKLSRQSPELGLVMEAARIAAMYDYALGTTRPNGSLNAMHDCQGERTGIQEDLMRAERSVFLQQAKLPDTLPPTSQFFPEAGQVFLRDSWDEAATYLTFDATLWGGGHCHLSRNSVQLHANGRSLLVDPGYLTYESSDPYSAHGKSTRAHNTLNLNGWNQGEVNPNNTRALHGDGYDFVASDYEGPYWSKPYTWNYAAGRGAALHAGHNRMLLWLRGRAVVIIDSFFREPRDQPEADGDAPSLEANWQLCEGGAVTLEDDARAVAHYGDSNLLMLFPLRWPELYLTLHEGETTPPRGWLPCSRSKFVPAPQLCLSSDRMTGNFAEIVTVLVPYTEPAAPRVTAEAHKTDGQKPGSLRLHWADGTTDELWWTYRMLLMLGAIDKVETDGALLHLHKDATGAVLHACAVEATYLAPYAVQPRSQPELIVVGSR